MPPMVPQRILLISVGHPELTRGGAQQVSYELFEELRQRGDTQCFLLASVDSEYPSLAKDGARITGFDGRDDEYLFVARCYDEWWHKASDPQAIEAYIEFLETIRPDVVHFHHFLTLGIDLISVTRRVLPACRIIFTFHEFRAICAADGHMVRRTDRSLCNRSSQVRCHQCFPERPPSAFVLRKLWLMGHFGHVDSFTCPSRFMIEHYVDWGIPREKIAHVSNGQRCYASQPGLTQASHRALPGPRNRFGYFGQLHDDKGVHIILRAVTLLRSNGFTAFRVEVNGGGLQGASPEIRNEIETFRAAEATLPAHEQLVVFNGAYHVDQLRTRMARIDWSIVPSVWWEIFGLVISEAWMFGKPTICSNVGGMSERVTDDVDGLLFEMASPQSLAAAMQRACTEPGLWQRLHDALPSPPLRSAMADGYRRLYGDAPSGQVASVA
jgi:glycosyltransferase involved in cell wall biosynthesis